MLSGTHKIERQQQHIIRVGPTQLHRGSSNVPINTASSARTLAPENIQESLEQTQYQNNDHKEHPLAKENEPPKPPGTYHNGEHLYTTGGKLMV